MNILVVQETDWIERNPIQHHHLLELMSRRGHGVTVIDYELLWHQKRGRGLTQRRRVFPGVQRIYPGAKVDIVRPGMVRLPGISRLSWLLTNTSELRRRLSQDRPDLVLAYSISNAYLAMRLARRHAVPFIFHVLDALHTLTESPPIRPIAAAVERRVFVGADQVIVANRKLMEYAQRMGASQDKITYVSAGADLTHFQPSDQADQHRHSLGLEPQHDVLLFMGWLYPFSGLREMIAALPAAARRCPTIRFLVVGHGPLLPELERLRDELGLHQYLLLLGQKPYDELPQLLAASDVCLLPFQDNASTRYVVPMKLYDYLAAGKPVVANHLPGLAAEFSQEDGVLLAHGPQQVLEQALALAQDRPRLQDLGAAARRRMEANGDWETVADRFEALLLSHVQPGRGRKQPLSR